MTLATICLASILARTEGLAALELGKACTTCSVSIARTRALWTRRALFPLLCERGYDGAAPSRENVTALNVEFATIAVPALAQFAAEPIAGLVDTAYLGRLGAAALGGAGVAISAHYATAKLFNDPLLRTSISIVASGDGASRQALDTSLESENCMSEGETSRDQAIRAALVLALAVGMLQLAFFAMLAPIMVTAMGAPVGSDMRPVALSYLRVCALQPHRLPPSSGEQSPHLSVTSHDPP